MTTDRKDEQEPKQYSGCPCLHTTPCDPRCSCVKEFSSRGCSRCCSYGSPEQQKAMAAHLATLAVSASAYDKLKAENHRLHVALINITNCTSDMWACAYADAIDDGKTEAEAIATASKWQDDEDRHVKAEVDRLRAEVERLTDERNTLAVQYCDEQATTERLNNRLLEIHREVGECLPSGLTVSGSPIDALRVMRAEIARLREREKELAREVDVAKNKQTELIADTETYVATLGWIRRELNSAYEGLVNEYTPDYESKSLQEIWRYLYEAISSLSCDHKMQTRALARQTETALSVAEKVREACATVCIQEWKTASNEQPECRQNEISHGCIASAKAIRALDVKAIVVAQAEAEAGKVKAVPIALTESANVVPGFWTHFKGGEYNVEAVYTRRDSGEQIVAYHNLLGDRMPEWRPLAEFLEHVERDGYSGPRFYYTMPQPGTAGWHAARMKNRPPFQPHPEGQCDSALVVKREGGYVCSQCGEPARQVEAQTEAGSEVSDAINNS